MVPAMLRGAAGPGAVGAQGRAAGLEDGRVVAHAEVVVRAPDGYVPGVPQRGGVAADPTLQVGEHAVTPSPSTLSTAARNRAS